MAEKFSRQLRRRGDSIWRAIYRHRFLRELHRGTLSIERFTYFIFQDYLYLLDFAQVLCHGGAKSPNLKILEVFARHALIAVEVERHFHASFGRTIGFSAKQLDRLPKGPITEAYTRHLRAIAGGGSLGEIVAAILPCYWIYGEVGRKLYKGRPRKPKIYREWIETYASEEYWKPLREQIRLTDDLGVSAGPDVKKLMTSHFLLSSRYEYLFWDQAYNLEKWRI
jgi:thiaminase (transcriptional activator TenA)